MSSKFGKIRPWTMKLTALERLERRHHIFAALFHLFLFILAGNEDMHRSLDELEIRPDRTTGFHGNR